MKTASLAFLLLGAGLATAANPVCSRPPYQGFLPLSRIPEAQQYCSARYPQATVTTTSTAPAKTVFRTVATTTKTRASGRVTSTTTVTTNTITITSTTSTTATSTVTVTSTIDFGAQLQKRAIAPTAKLVAALTETATDFASTVCLCIQSPPTRTITTTPTSFRNVTSTAYVTRPATVFSSVTATSTSSVVETTTVTTVSTTTVASNCPTATPKACGTGANTACKDLQNDKFNCGTCGNKCSTGYGCHAGQCALFDQCDFTGSIEYCYGGTSCVCYETTEEHGFCASPYTACGQECASSDDCPGNNVCLTTATVGCTGTVGSCTIDVDLATCPNPSNGFKFFSARRHRRAESHRNLPGGVVAGSD